ncbi:MAG: Trk system potassium transporter TrkA [Solobacterium sp.]|nr:Trk system potassium transporter TrkA [Solobacterium sp.]
MKILIAGAGKVGRNLTDELSDEGHDITLIDRNPKILEEVIGKYDVNTLNGNCASKTTLEEAGIANMDVFVAATNLDEVNLLSSITAHALNPNVRTIARIRDPEYIDQASALKEVFALSLIVNPEAQTASEIAKLLKYPGFLKRESFAKTRVDIVELKVKEGSVLEGVQLLNLENTTKSKVLVCAILRNGEPHIPGGTFTIQKDDRIFVTGEALELHHMLKRIGVITKPVKHAIIAGGGKISYYLCNDLHKIGIATSIIEANPVTCENLSKSLPFATIIQGDVSDQAVLDSEEIDEYDAFVSLTGMDELNIVSSMYASVQNVPHIVTKLGRGGEAKLIGDMPIGSVVCPKELCTADIVRYVRALENSKGAAITIHRIADGKVEAIEFIVEEDTKNIGKQLKDIRTKDDVLIASIRHGRNLIIPNGTSSFHKGDSVVVVTHKNAGIFTLNDIFEG